MIWILPIALAIALALVRIGQVMYAAGTARSKNAAGAALRSLSDLCVAPLAFWAVGAAILFFVPGLLFGWIGADETVFASLIVVLIGTGSVGATLAERSKFPVILVSSAVLAGLIIPIAGHLAWVGWLPRFTDVGGAAVVHVSVGIFALIGAMTIGPRDGKYNRDGSTTMIPGHNVPVSVLGIITMIGGFVPYVMAMTAVRFGRPFNVSGSSMGQAGVNALVCIAAAGLSAMAISRFRYGKADVGLALLGALGGAVAITAAGGYIGSPAAFLTGAVAGAIVPLASVTLDLIAHIDDPGGAISVHLLGGLWGTLSAGLFLPGTFTDRLVHFGAQLLGAVVIAALSAAISFATFYALKKTIGVRSKEADEFDGLDLAEHDIGAYPDFQQTMIKSYHLREA